MEPPLRLESSNSDAIIEFSDVQGEEFTVTITARDHSAIRRVSAYADADGVARLFAEVARAWRGWEGSKVWESIEGELRMELTIDRAGHVTLGVRIRSLPGGRDPWQHNAELTLDAGQLEGIARNAQRLWSIAASG